MTDETQMTKAELLANIEQGWNEFQAYLATLTYEQVTLPTDPAGWTAKDHIVHLAIWEDSLNALLEKKSRREHMGIADEAAWKGADWDAINAVIQQRYHDLPLRDLATLFFGIHEKLVGKINALSDANLQRPYKEFQSDFDLETPIIHWMIIDTYEHYDEHKDYIDIIANSRPSSIPNILEAIKTGWDALNTYLDSLSAPQLTQLTDAAGWTVKDHVIHLAIWEDGIYALLERLKRIEHMGIDEATWERSNIDEINGLIQQRYQNLSWANVEQKRQQIHQRLVDKIASMTDEDLQRPYRYYELASTQDEPVLSSIAGNTFGHYSEHLPWIKAIATQSNWMTTKAKALEAMQTGWDEFNAYLDSLTEQQLTQPTDAAGWTAKDHVIHLAVWEDSVNAIFTGQNQMRSMGVDDPEAWEKGDWDTLNAVIYAQNKNLSLAEVRRRFRDVHERLLALVQSLTDEDLQRPYNSYLPDLPDTYPVINPLVGNTSHHYAEHRPWIEAIVRSSI